jgi:ATP phosphoribosyltransferase regulatory subunit HisZ
MNNTINIKIDIKPITINEINYYTVKQFAVLTNHSEQSIRRLMTYGNKKRRLKFARIGDKPFIFATELQEFPFTLPGASVETYSYGVKTNASTTISE